MTGDTKILLVEDDHSFAATIDSYLGVYYNITVAGGVSAARQLLGDHSYDLMILDNNLPDGEGFDVISIAKDGGHNPATIVLTGHHDLRKALAAIERGADDYLVKSDSTIQDLLLRIPLNLKRRELRQQVSDLRSRPDVRLPANLNEISKESYREFMNSCERHYLNQCLKFNGNRISRLASLIGIGNSTAFLKAQKLGLGGQQ